jgi:predicted GNAT family acetyltransferase/glutaredoxin
MSDRRPTLHQAEWCPFSSAVREVLTELGLEVELVQVEPRPEQRERLRALAGTDEIPVLVAEDGGLYRGTREIFEHLRGREAWRFAAGHRRQFADHRDARESDVPGQLLEYFRGSDELEALEGDAGPADAVVAHVPERDRYELRLDGTLIGLLAYRLRDGRVAFTHTEIEPACERRGFGTRLVRAALDDARAKGLTVLPLCPFVARVVDRHPEYESLLVDRSR